MKQKSLKNYTLRYLIFIFLGIIAIWAASFYLFITEEVYDNIDDGLKDSQLRIIKEIDSNADILKVTEYGIAQYKITPLPKRKYSDNTYIYNSSMYMDYDGDHEPVRILQNIFNYKGNYYQIEIYTSTLEEDEFVENLLIALLVLYVALVTSIVAINNYILKKAWKPFYQILGNLKKYKIGKGHNYATPDFKVKEFNELTHELSSMIERNETIYSQQKQFIENASHELQTPLAIAGTKLELIMDDESLDESLLLKINEVNQTIVRMKRLNKSLLTLSKIENNQFQAAEVLDFNKIIHASLKDLESLTELKQIEISIEEKGIFEFEMNYNLSLILINNLLKNAIVHSGFKEFLKISISPKTILIKNPGLEALDSNFIFERFHKDIKDEFSTGLGLAIVKSIIALYPNISIEYEFDYAHIFKLIQK